MSLIKKIISTLSAVTISSSLFSAQGIFTVTNIGDSGSGTLRQAILDSNAHNPAPDLANLIQFQIPGTGPFTIIPLSALPSIFTSVVIDGTSQPGWVPNTATDGSTNTVLQIELNGINSRTFSNINGLNIFANNCAIKGMVINNFFGIGIVATGVSNFKLGGCFVGTDVAGTTIKRNRGAVNLVANTSSTVGGTTPNDINVLAGGFNGIFFGGGYGTLLTNCSSTTVQGNLLGVDKTGLNTLGQTSYGIAIFGGSNDTISNNTITGGSIAGISCARFFASVQATIRNNKIGTNVLGTKVNGTSNANGICLYPVGSGTYNCLITQNTISGNLADGVAIGQTFLQPFSSFPGVTLKGNLIGTDATGRAALANGSNGISISQMINPGSVIIGGPNVGDGNVISGNLENGIRMNNTFMDTNVVQGNLIGLDLTGTQPLGNGKNGIQIGLNRGAATLAVIGGTQPGERNVISSNGANGILIQSYSANNKVLDNYIGLSITGNQVARSNCSDYGNGENGISLLAATDTFIEGNLIINNKDNGIEIRHEANHNVVQQNIIQCNANHGISIIDSSFNLIGADDDIVCSADCGELIHGNLITCNNGFGVVVREHSFEADENSILSNSIYKNKEEGIELAQGGHSKDPNNLQQAPKLTSAKLNDSLVTVTGELSSLPDTDFLIQFFVNSKNKNEEGKTFAAKIVVTTHSSGKVRFAAILPCAEQGDYISATATRLVNGQVTDTSEFSQNVKVR